MLSLDYMIPPLKIGSLAIKNNLISAPMAGVSDLAGRYFAAKYGAGLTVTEMATSRGLIIRNKRTMKTILTHPDARPFSVQIFGEKPEIVGEAARIVQDAGADALDLNVGCPVKKIVRAGAGAALLKNIPSLTKIIEAVRKSISIPFTIKIRSGWDEKNIVAKDVARIAQEEGVDAVTLHPRTASQGFGGIANWALIGEVAAAVDIPIIASGDIKTPEDALAAINQTGCAGLMIGRAAMGNPFLFREIAAALEAKDAPPPASPSEKLTVALEHLDISLGYHEAKTGVALWRKHLCWYARGMPFAARYRAEIFDTWDTNRLREIAHEIFESKNEIGEMERSVCA